MRAAYRLIGLLVAPAVAAAAGDKPPEKAKNLRFFPKDLPRPALIQRMREFSFALGVRCQYCHSGGDGVSFEGVDFASDAKPAKVKARAMLRMTAALNDGWLAKLPERHDPPVRMDCVICHRGLPVPRTLATELGEVISKQGVPAAVARYRELREKAMPLGQYSFDEWTMNELARSLVEAGNVDAALAMLELNAEYYPKSADIDFAIGELLVKRGQRDAAIARFKAGLEKRPGSPAARKRVEELEKGQ